MVFLGGSPQGGALEVKLETTSGGSIWLEQYDKSNFVLSIR